MYKEVKGERDIKLLKERMGTKKVEKSNEVQARDNDTSFGRFTICDRMEEMLVTHSKHEPSVSVL